MIKSIDAEYLKKLSEEMIYAETLLLDWLYYKTKIRQASNDKKSIHKKLFDVYLKG